MNGLRQAVAGVKYQAAKNHWLSASVSRSCWREGVKFVRCRAKLQSRFALSQKGDLAQICRPEAWMCGFFSLFLVMHKIFCACRRVVEFSSILASGTTRRLICLFYLFPFD
ncbi:hypothetical protein [Serratia rhizosphaerae]|uniref:hypothetical protein n=1 Tax=Serratia rhizosphaerae TaxID=2597702 RepID=UPI002DC02104|nr:hypothetical protein [Serratia rhizosphaerae]MEB6335652.1 hypothetical protein [Serratia rhizosphaerae]